MERKHATVLALTIVLVGLMFFSVDTPFVFQQEVNSTVHEAPENIEQIADEPVPEEPLRLNVVENSDFEEWNTGTDRPEVWSVQGSAYQRADRAYTDDVYAGSYAGYTESQGNAITFGSSYLQSVPVDYTTALLEPGISLSFKWNTLTNPDIDIGAEIFVYLRTNNGSGTYYNFYYYLSRGTATPLNTSNNAHFMLNDTINQWNSFDRNITEDFIAAFGPGALTSEAFVWQFWFYARSYSGSTSMIQAVVDDVVLYNTTYSSWIENGNFESGTGNGWTIYNTDAGYVQQSTDKTHGAYSLNVTVPSMRGGSAYARCFETFPSNFGYHALYPRMNIIEMDWKYNDTVGAGLSQYAYFRLIFYNGTSYNIYFYFGYGTNYIARTNDTINTYIELPGFSTREVWQHAQIDVYEVCTAVGLFNMSITGIGFYVYQGQLNAGVELLVDNFKMETYPTSDPTFEYVDTWGQFDPFIGWERDVGDGVLAQSTEAHSGQYSANITVENGDEGIKRNLLYANIDPSLSTDFWWRLEEIQDTGSGYAWIDMEFIVSGTNRHIRYVLGSTSSYTISNSSYIHILVDGYNQTGVWFNIARNITADIESAFSVSAADCYLFYFGVEVSCNVGVKISLLVDDLHFKDMDSPSIDSVLFDATPMYYEDVLVRVSAADVRPGVSSVFVLYSINSWSSTEVSVGVYDEGDWFNATIPAQIYNAHVDFYIQVADGCGNEKIDDNSGSFYSYTVGDDLDPTLTITNPLNNTDQSGLLTITANASDPGSGIEWVQFNPDGSGAVTDYDLPYQQNWNLDDETLGSHFVIVTVRDNLGHQVTKTHYFTVVDTTDPVVSSPPDIATTYIMGSEYINWTFSDTRPDSFSLLENGTEIDSGVWPAAGFYALEIDPTVLSIGHYNYTIVLTDEAGNTAFDTVLVEIYEILPTTPTTPTTTTTTSTTDTTTTGSGSTDTSTDTTTGPTGGGDILSPVMIVAIIGVIGILLVVLIVIPKMKKT